MAGFRGAFAQTSFATERPGAKRAHYVPGIPVSSRFRLIEGSTGEGAFRLQVVIEWRSAADSGSISRVPDSTATTNEATVLIAALSPEAAAANARPIPVRERMVFHFPAEPRTKFYSSVGWRVALLSLETLHHLTEDLDPDLRLRLDQVDRTPFSAR